jgi:hypothetical protein
VQSKKSKYNWQKMHGLLVYTKFILLKSVDDIKLLCLLLAYLTYSLTLMMDAVHFSKTLVNMA